MSIEKNLQSLRRQIAADFNAGATSSISGAFGATGFSPLSEISVSLLLLLRRQTGTIASYGVFAKHFMELISAPDRKAAVLALLPDQPAFLQARLFDQLADMTHLPRAFAWKIYTAQEAAALPKEQLLKELYRIVLKREIEPAALESWGNMLKRGASIQSVIHAIDTSEEAAIVKSGQHLVVMEGLSAPMEEILRNFRHLQEVELQRIYDFARLLTLLDPMEDLA